MTSQIPIFCFSHLRWDFVYQRPQHLMSRCQRHTDVFYFEEPVWEQRQEAVLQEGVLLVRREANGVHVLTPRLPAGISSGQVAHMQRGLLENFMREQNIDRFFAWYYTPMALLFTAGMKPQLAIYDCMDELSAFQGAPAELIDMERRLFAIVDAVFVGGRSLYEVKRKQHDNVFLYPSSIDREHFAAARRLASDPADQQDIPHPRIGFYGVLDERLDRELLASLAADHASWHFVLLGPTAKISVEDLPKAPNIHYLGHKSYLELPQYLACWDVAMMPFAINASTRFISPTKTPEFLAAAKQVVSTPVCDVVEPYGRLGLVNIAATANAFGEAIARCLEGEPGGWLQDVDKQLSRSSWDSTFDGMWGEMMRLRQAGEVTSV